MSDTVIEKDNYLRFVIFFIDVGKDTLLKIFTYIDTENPGKVIFPLSNCPEFEKKIKKKFPQNLQRTILEAKSAADFDISILSRLLCNVFPYLIPEGLKHDVDRLRQIRNDNLAHPTEARFPNEVFEQLWQEVGMIFKRITDEVAPGYRTALATTVEEYKNQPIDATKAREYICYLETQIEALRKELFDFTTLCKNIQTPFLQYVKFLLNCGSSILSAYLCQLLEKQNVSLERLLFDNYALMSRELPDWMTQQLYSRSEDAIEVNTDTNSWDLSVITTVIEIIFGKDIEEYDLTAIVSIRQARETYANTAIYAITKDDRFNQEREDLVSSLKTLAMHTGKGCYQVFKRFLDEYRSTTETGADSKELFAKLKCHGPGIKDIRDLHRESVAKLTAETGSTVLFNETLELEVMLQIACEDSSKQVEAESFLHSFLASILANPNSKPKGPDFPEVRTTIRKINNIPTVRLTCVQKSCLLITVECRGQGLFSLINFIDGSEFLHQLDLISAELMDHFDDLFILNGHVTLDSLVNILMLQEVEAFGHDQEKIIYERQGEEREPLNVEKPENRIRQDPDISKHKAVKRNLQKKLEKANERVMVLQHKNSYLQTKAIESKLSRDAVSRQLYNLKKERAKLAKWFNEFKKVHAERELEEKHRKDWTLTLLVYTAINERQLCRQATNQLYDLRRVNLHQANQMLILTNEISQLKRDKIDLANQIYRLKSERKQFEDDLSRKIRVLANDRRFKKRLSSLGMLSLMMKSTPSERD